MLQLALGAIRTRRNRKRAALRAAIAECRSETAAGLAQMRANGCGESLLSEIQADADRHTYKAWKQAA